MTEPVRRGLSEIAGDFLSHRRQDLQRFAAGAQAVERQGYDIAANAGRYFLRPELAGLDLGLRILGGGLGPAVAKRQQIATQRPAPSRLAPRQPVLPPTKSLPQRSWLDRNEVAKALAGDAARNVAIPLGAARGVWHTVEDLGDAAVFTGRLFNPMDAHLSPPGESARDELANGLKGAGRYAMSRFAHPEMAMNDIGDAWRQFRLETDPGATPQANTFMGEVKRNFDVGLNQGEAAGDVGQLLLGVGELKALSGIGKLSKAARKAKFIAEGHDPALARQFSRDYKGMGHHLLRRSWTLPSGGPIPPWLSESPFFLLKPRGILDGDFQKLHVGVDRDFHGGRRIGGGGWSAKKLGWKKYGPLERLWYGTPKALKYTALGGGSTAAGAAVDAAQGEERR